MSILHNARPLVISLVGLFVLALSAEAQRPSQGRPSGGGGGGGGGGRPAASRPSSPASRPSAAPASRPSSSTMSRPSAAPTSRPSAAPTYQRGSAPQASRPAPAPAPAPAPRYEQPSAPRYEQPAAPRYEQPSAPRYEQPSAPRHQPSTPNYQPDAPRYEQPGSTSGAPGATRYDTPGTRVYDGGGSRDDGPSSRGDWRGSPEPARIDRSTPTPYQPRVWQPNAPVDLSGAVRQPRTPVPTLSGSRGGPEAGLASGRLARAGLDPKNPSAAGPRPAVSDDSLRARYGAAAPDTGTARTSKPERGNGLAAGRTGTVGRARETDAKTRTRTPEAGRQKQPAPSGRTARTGDVDRRVGNALRGTAGRRGSPEAGPGMRTAGDAVTARVARGSGIVIGAGAGFYSGGCGWDPYGDGWWDDNCGWYWNSCWNGGWWWSFGWGWPYGSCWWGWPGYSSYSCWPWWYGSSYYGWGYSPAVYTTVIYEQSDSDSVVYQEPAAAAPAQGAVAKVPAEVRAALDASADESLVAGDAAFREGRYSDAVRHYARAVEYAPERGSLWLILSDALFATGDYHYAAYALRRAVELDPTLLETLVDKHGWYSDPTEFDRHIAWAESYLRDHVLDEDARLVLAANYLFAKRFASSSDVLESAFGEGLRDTQAGRLILERSRRALGLQVK